ncbi:MAG TPA: hypothetical protein VIK89_08710, partial [Cytophagaceae bacterium]
MTNHLRKASLRILKTGIIIFSGVLIFCSLLIGILHLPFVQRKIADYISATLSQKTQTRFRVGGLRFGLGDELKLTDVFIEDQQGKTLVRSKTIKGDPYWTALLKKKIILEHVLVEDADVNLYRTNNGAFNYQFLINAFTDTTASSGEPWVFTIEESSLKNVRFTYIDEQQGIDLSAYSEDAWVLFETLGLKDLHMKIEGVEFLNTNVFLQRRTPVVIDTSTQSAQPTPFRITALNAKFENSTFEYKDLSAPQSMAINKTAFDFTHINAKDVNGIVDRFFYSQGRLIVVSVAKASLKEKSGLELKDLAGRIAINEENILVDVQKLITPYSYFDDTIRVSVPVDLTFEKIALNSRFENDTISVKDLAYFVSGIDKYNYLQSDKAVISGIVSGGISYFKGKDIEVKTANDFYYKGSFQGQDFTQLSEARINFVMDNLTVGKSILRKVFSAADTLVDTGVIARVIASGNIEGRLLEPVVKVNVRSHAGSVKAHGKISFDSSFSFAGYKGKLSANDVLLGKLLRKEVLGLVSFNGEFVTTSSEIKAYEINITELDYKGYKYGSIYSLGKYKDKELTAVLKSEDTAFKTDVKFRADLSTTFFKIVGDINYIDFAKTNFSKKYLSLSGKVDAEWSGLHPDSIEGKAVIANLVLASCDNTI